MLTVAPEKIIFIFTKKCTAAQIVYVVPIAVLNVYSKVN